jgi:hypothetical protein
MANPRAGNAGALLISGGCQSLLVQRQKARLRGTISTSAMVKSNSMPGRRRFGLVPFGAKPGTAARLVFDVGQSGRPALGTALLS